MLIFGKIIGVVVGTMINFPFGTILGLWIGHLFDRGLRLSLQNMYLGNGDWTRSRAQKAFFNATFQVMGHIAKADGHVSKKEIAMAETIMSRMRLSADLRTKAIELFNAGKNPDLNIKSIIIELRTHCGSNLALLQMFLDIQQQAAFVDGISLKKQSVIQQIAELLGIQTFGSHFNQGQQQYQSTGGKRQQRSNLSTPKENPYKVLGVKRSDEYSVIKKAYRKLMSQNHPDKLVSQGLPPEMMKLATEKTQKIQSAYEQICHEKGFKK